MLCVFKSQKFLISHWCNVEFIYFILGINSPHGSLGIESELYFFFFFSECSKNMSKNMALLLTILSACLLITAKSEKESVSQSVGSNSLRPCLPGFSAHGILQARILEWVAISFSRGSFQPRNQTWVSCISDRFFTIWRTQEAHGECLLN